MPHTQAKHPYPQLPNPGLLAQDLATILRTTPRRIAAWEREGKLPAAIRIGRCRVWRHADVAHLLGDKEGCAA